MRLQWIVFAAVTLQAASADTLTLRNGGTVQGSYLGGSARQVRMAVGDSVQVFDVGEVAAIQFEDAAATAAPGRQIMRPDTGYQPAPPAQAVSAYEIPAGTAVRIRMIDDVDSKVNETGQKFRATVDEPVMVGGEVLIPRGADAITRLAELKTPGKIAGGGEMTLALFSVTVNGQSVEVNAQEVTTTGESRKGESAKVIGGTAALGAIIGAIAGGGKGAAIGGVSGAGAGTAVQVLTQGTRVRIPSETRLTFTLQQGVRIP